MQIIEPSATIIEKQLNMGTLSQRIDSCAATCYQRPPKSKDADAIAFCTKYGIEAGHRAMFEFATIHLVMDYLIAESLENEKYMMVSQISATHGCVTGSIRAWMEAKSVMGEFIREEFLAHYFPVFFGKPIRTLNQLIRFANHSREEIPEHHRHVAVRFIISRAMSHELVRHRPCGFLQESQRYCAYDKDVVFIRPLWAVGQELLAHFEEDCAACEDAYQERRGLKLSPQQARGALNNDCKTDVVVYTHLGEWDHIFGLRCSSAADPEMRRVMIPLREEMHAQYPNYQWRN